MFGETWSTNRFQAATAPRPSAVMAPSSNGIIADVIGALRSSQKFTAITGGGVIPLNGRLSTVLDQEDKEPGRDYILMDGELSVTLNAIGTLFGLYFYIAELRRREGAR